MLNKTITAVVALINIMTGKRYWYQLEINFMRNGRTISTGDVQIGLVKRADILNSRVVKKTIGADFYKDRRVYGTKMSYKVVGYLGKLKKEERANV